MDLVSQKLRETPYLVEEISSSSSFGFPWCFKVAMGKFILRSWCKQVIREVLYKDFNLAIIEANLFSFV